ncbi:AzlD domain-containing protein [Amycolatopsis thermophila]|uniref:Branched-subunit amino acid transport protein n=1 Tax=Amycolatopsis thermophila TaxID=206084 RepID=A0ABU0EXE4_9PSEU|nr:AzlD domain-containing protein [Amycolatopsis thermophila]MDQ0379962.1 branched-subunit amino acid transport protein [Amycolatopsis thermophila]
MTVPLLIAIAVLAAGTFAFRFAGPLLRAKIRVPDRVQKLMGIAAAVLLTAVVATNALAEGHSFAGYARPLGVAVAGVLAWRKAPFLVVVVSAAAVTALLRLAGVP